MNTKNEERNLRFRKSVLVQTAIFTIFMVVLIVFVYNFNIPNPNMILIAALVLSLTPDYSNMK